MHVPIFLFDSVNIYNIYIKRSSTTYQFIISDSCDICMHFSKLSFLWVFVNSMGNTTGM